MKALPILAVAVGSVTLSLPTCEPGHGDGHEQSHEERHKIIVTQPVSRDVVITQEFVCQIHSRRHIEVRALQEGYLEAIEVKEGQKVKKDKVLSQVVPVLYKARLDAERAEAKLSEIKLKNTKQLFEQKIVSDQEVALCEAELARAKAKVKLAEAEMDFTSVRAPFDGILDQLMQQQGSLVKKEDLLTTLSDNGEMWVYFNVPEAGYLDYMAKRDENASAGTSMKPKEKSSASHAAEHKPTEHKPTEHKPAEHKPTEHKPDDSDETEDKTVSSDDPSELIELRLANGKIFTHPGRVAAIEGQFNNETGTIAFRADFPNPQGLLRHGQTGNVLIRHTVKNAIVIPQRATFEILEKRYVWVVGENHVVRQREITILHELEDIFVIKGGLKVNEHIVLEGVRQVHDGEKIEPEFRASDKALSDLKYHAE